MLNIVNISLVFSLLIIVLLSFFSEEVTLLLFGFESATIFIIIVSAVFVSIYSRFLSLKLRLEERPMAYSAYLILLKLGILVFLGLFYILDFKFQLVQLLTIYLISSLISFLYLVLINPDIFKKISFPARDELKQSLTFGFPMIFGGVAYWGINAVDRLFVEMYLGLEQLAVYSVAFSISSVTVILQSIFSLIWIADVYKNANNDDEAIRMISKAGKLVSIVSFIAYILFLIALPLIMLLLPSNYEGAKEIMPIIFICPLFFIFSEISVVGMGIVKRTSLIMGITIICFLVNSLLNYSLIPLFGLLGAAIATLATFFLMTILRCEISRYVWRSYPRLNIYLNMFLLFLLTLLTSSGLLAYIYQVIIFIPSLFYLLYLLNKEINIVHRIRAFI